MRFHNDTHLSSAQLRRLITKLANLQLDPPQRKSLTVTVTSPKRQRHKVTFSYFVAATTSAWPGGRINLRVRPNYVPPAFREAGYDELAFAISRAIKYTLGNKATVPMIGAVQGIAERFPVGVQRPRARKVAPEVPETEQTLARTTKKRNGITKEISVLERRVKYRTTKMKRLQTLQKKDERRLKYLQKAARNAGADFDLAAAEAELEREAAAEREDAQFHRADNQTEGWMNVIKKLGEESR